MHPDGYVELRDRAKDVVVSGGENISTVEVEQAIVSHPTVLEAAVMGVPDDRWGERPGVRGASASAWRPPTTFGPCARPARRLKYPNVFEMLDELPQTSTGKVRKVLLREREWAGHDRRIN